LHFVFLAECRHFEVSVANYYGATALRILAIKETMSTTIFGWFLGRIFHPWLFMNHEETLPIFDAAEFVAALFD
jgi:hypothetical protein